MPELPEVETIVRELNESSLTGLTIANVHIFWPNIVSGLSASDFSHRIINQRIIRIYRRGKFIVFELKHDSLLVHLRMTGKIIINTSNEIPHKSEHLLLQFSDGRFLHYEDQRKFGRWTLLANVDEKFGVLGLEPLSKDFTKETFTNLLTKYSAQIKPFLLNQRFIAGLGNIYVDEALWEAKIHPQCHTNTLSAKQIDDLFAAIPKVLNAGIANLGTSLGPHRSNYFSVSGKRGGNQYKLKVFRQEGHPCPRCKTIIVKTRVAQRGTHLCPRCQKMPIF